MDISCDINTELKTERKKVNKKCKHITNKDVVFRVANKGGSC